jgi:hypothetical protein
MNGMAGGDTLNFAFITVFLIFWCLPMTAVLIQIGTDGVASRETGPERRVLRRIASTSLVTGAGFFLAYGLWAATLMLGRPILPGFELAFDAALILLFATNAFACALRIQVDPEAAPAQSPANESRWLTGVLLAVTALVTSHLIALVWGGFQFGWLALAAPGAAWLIALAWSVWQLRESRVWARGRVGTEGPPES